MPGPVEQLTKAADEVERYALQHGEDHDLVKSWFYENLQVEHSSHPQETYSQTVRQAVDVTKHEIRENADIHWEQEREEMQTRSEAHIRQIAGGDYEGLRADLDDQIISAKMQFPSISDRNALEVATAWLSRAVQERVQAEESSMQINPSLAGRLRDAPERRARAHEREIEF